MNIQDLADELDMSLRFVRNVAMAALDKGDLSADTTLTEEEVAEVKAAVERGRGTPGAGPSEVEDQAVEGDSPVEEVTDRVVDQPTAPGGGEATGEVGDGRTDSAVRERPEEYNQTEEERILSWEEVTSEVGIGVEDDIAILGMSGVGKTAYLYAIGQCVFTRDLGEWEVSPVSPELQRFMVRQDLSNFQKTDPEVTPMSFPLFHLFRRKGLGPVFDFCPFSRKNATQEIPVKSLDPSGDLVPAAISPESAKVDISNAGVNELRRLIARCRAFLIIIDATLAEKGGDEAEITNKRDQDWGFFIQAIAKLDSGIYGTLIKRPVAVVVNKADKKRNTLRISELIRLRKSGRYKEAEEARKRTKDQRQRAAEEFVRKWFPNTHRSATKDGLINDLKFFSMSCWGHAPQEIRPDGGANVGSSIYPTAVHEPLEWLADRLAAQEKRVGWMKLCAASVIFILLFLGSFLGAGKLSRSLAASGNHYWAERFFDLSSLGIILRCSACGR
jgi:hypothetical protein